MHFQERKENSLMTKAKEMVFERIPEAIQIFDEFDVTYFIYAELADSIIIKIEDKFFIEKVINLLEELVSFKDESLETMIILQVFQKIYPLKAINIAFSEAIKEREMLYCLYTEYSVKYFEVSLIC